MADLLQMKFFGEELVTFWEPASGPISIHADLV